MHEFATEIELCGVPVEVVVRYKIISYGSSDSYYEPGDPPELEIHHVYSVNRPGVDYYDLLDRSPAWPIVFSPSYRADEEVTDPVQVALFGTVSMKWNLTKFDDVRRYFPLRLQWGSSMLDKLIDATYEQETFQPDYDWDEDRGYHL